MGTFESPLKSVTAQVLERLKTDKIKEGLQLEYKEALPAENAREKFLSSVTAFANTSGGDLIYGIRAKRDEDDVHTGEIDEIVGLHNVNFDLETQRLHGWTRSCIEPRLVITTERIDRGDKPPCLLVRVPRSLSAPHLITTFRNPFYGRHSGGGKYTLGVNEIRQAFISAMSARDRVRDIRRGRIAAIMQGETPTHVGSGAKLIFHCLPLTPDDANWIRFREAEGDKKAIAMGLRLGLVDHTPAQTWNYNADGFVVSSLRPDNSYTQVFHDCGIESVDVSLEDHKSTGRVAVTTWGINIERAIINALRRYQSFWISIGVSGPIALSLTLTGVKGWTLITGHFTNEGVCIDRDCLMSGDVIIDDLSVDADVVLKPLFDFMWNASGYRESPHYKESRWVDPAR